MRFCKPDPAQQEPWQNRQWKISEHGGAHGALGMHQPHAPTLGLTLCAQALVLHAHACAQVRAPDARKDAYAHTDAC
eukprot:10050432-Alexandrium_andersonii.AAC.1